MAEIRTPKWSRKTKIGVGTGGFFLFSALFVWVVLLFLPPKSACLVLVGASYDTNLAVPHNVYGWEGLNALERLSGIKVPMLFNWGTSLIRVQTAPSVLGAADDWAKGLEKFDEKTVVIALAGHGGYDANDKEAGPFLLRQDCDYRYAKDDRLYIKTVLQRLKDDVPAGKNKVLILDATQASALWPLGMLDNEFARGLEELEPEIEKVPNLVVLSASDKDQRSWASDELRKTVFTHYVAEGLKGFADEAPSGDGDGRVYASELFKYVSRNVKRWVRSNRDALQTPVLLGKKDVAERIELAVVKSRPEEAAEDATPFPAQELSKAWKRFEAQRAQVPAPWVYAAPLWRQYQDTLLRYEQLLRAGAAPESQQRLEAKLTQLEEEMGRARRLDAEASSAQNTLAMPFALGSAGPAAGDLDRRGKELWDAEQPEQKWKTIEAGADESSRRLLRTQLCGWLLDRAARNPQADLGKASRLLQVLWRTGNQRPAEAHFAVMLNQDIPTKPAPPAPLLELALQTRRIAENVALAVRFNDQTLASQADVYPYSEQVFPWIQKKVAEADQSRRLGEDGLFAADPKSWERARRDLEKARALYLEARGDARRVQGALQARDEVMSSLPYYSAWVAQRRVGTDERRRSAEEAEVREFEDLWKALHRLAHLLEVPDPARVEGAVPLNADDLKPRSLTQQTEAVRAAYEKVVKDFEARCKKVSGARLPSEWRDTDDLLLVPAGTAELRLKLLTNAHDISHGLQAETAVKKGEDVPPATDEERKENMELAHQAAQRQGRMALAALGRDWFEDPVAAAGRPADGFSALESAVRRLDKAERWADALALASSDIGAAWRRIPEELKNKKRWTDPRGSSAKPREGELLSAERLARLVEGAAAVPAGPLVEARRLRTHRLFLDMARRTRLDHWFAHDPKAEQPYYVAAGMRFVEDARELVARGRGDLAADAQKEYAAEADAVRNELNEPGRLKIAGPPQLEITSEQRASADYRLEAEPGVPGGYPVFWLEADAKYLRTGSGAERFLREVKEKQPAARLGSFQFDVLPTEPPREPRCDNSRVTLSGRFRGQRIEVPTPVNLHRLPEVVVFQHQPPPRAAISVQASQQIHAQFAAANGAIAIVLDCSGSMLETKEVTGNDQKGYDYKNKHYDADPKGGWSGELYDRLVADFSADRNFPCNYHEATKALKRMLQEVPPQTTVSIFVFSHKNQGVTEPNQNIERLRDPSPWNPQELPALMKQLDELVPFNRTPLVRAMRQAKREGFPKVPGFKTLVVLTDGDDSEFAERDPDLNPGRDLGIPTFLKREFGDEVGQGIAVNMVGFRIPTAEERKRFQDRFGVVAKPPLSGRLYTVEATDDLVKELKRSLEQKLRFQVVREDGEVVPTADEAGEVVTTSGEPGARWVVVPPGAYTVRVRTDKVVGKRVELAAGDCLLLGVKPDATDLERIPMAPTFGSRVPGKSDKGWLLSIVQHEFKGDGSMEILAALEKDAGGTSKRDTLKQIRPRFSWFELKPQASPRPVALRWGPLTGYLAPPTWELRVPAWPTAAGGGDAAPAELKAWWNPDLDPAPAAELRRTPGVDLAQAFPTDPVPVGKDPAAKAALESITVEEMDVETSPGVKEKKRSCLVVRLSYSPEAGPVWVEPDGPQIEGHEHRFYSAANKYTGVFWGDVQKDVATVRLTGLRLFALAGLKPGAHLTEPRLEGAAVVPRLPQVLDTLSGK